MGDRDPETETEKGEGQPIYYSLTNHTLRYMVRLGEHSLTKLDWTEQLRHTTFSITHPSYQGAYQNHEHDLRLLRLNRPIRLTHAVRPVALSSSCAPTGAKCHISGWGTTNKPWGKRA